jgi:hypothetical protein
MTGLIRLLLGGFTTVYLICAQQTPQASADTASASATAPVQPSYTPPTHGERFETYLSHTYGIGSILEAAARAGIDQGLDRPSQWREGAEGYAERFGSAMGAHAVRGTTAYAFSELFQEDLRYIRCAPGCSAANRFNAAFENTFEARKGSDGHEAFSVARLVGPISGGLVASTWRPDGFSRSQLVKEIGFSYGLGFMRNLAREFVRH